MSQKPRSVLARYANPADLDRLEFKQRRELAAAIKATLISPPLVLEPWHYAFFAAGGVGFVWMLAHLAAGLH